MRRPARPERYELEAAGELVALYCKVMAVEIAKLAPLGHPATRLRWPQSAPTKLGGTAVIQHFLRITVAHWFPCQLRQRGVEIITRAEDPEFQALLHLIDAAHPVAWAEICRVYGGTKVGGWKRWGDILIAGAGLYLEDAMGIKGPAAARLLGVPERTYRDMKTRYLHRKWAARP